MFSLLVYLFKKQCPWFVDRVNNQFITLLNEQTFEQLEIRTIDIHNVIEEGVFIQLEERENDYKVKYICVRKSKEKKEKSRQMLKLLQLQHNVSKHYIR